jgi:hypothetical protein
MRSGERGGPLPADLDKARIAGDLVQRSSGKSLRFKPDSNCSKTYFDSQAVVFHSPFEQNQKLLLARQPFENLQHLASCGIERVMELYFVCFRSPPSAAIG